MEKRRAEVTPLKKIIYHENTKEESNWWDESDLSAISQKKISAIFVQMQEYKKIAEKAESEKLRIAQIKIEELLLQKEESIETVKSAILQCQQHIQTISQLRKRISQQKQVPSISKPAVSEEEIIEYIEKIDRLEEKIHVLLSKYPPNYTKVVKTLEQENKDLYLTTQSLAEKIERFLNMEKTLENEKKELESSICKIVQEASEKEKEILTEKEQVFKEKEILQKRVDELYLAIETLNSTVVDKTRELENNPTNRTECVNGCHNRIKELEIKEIDRLEEVAFLVRKYIDTGKQNDQLLLEIESLKTKTKTPGPPTSTSFPSPVDSTKESEILNLKAELERSKLEYLERKSSAQYHKRKSLQYEAEMTALRKSVGDLEVANSNLQQKLQEVRKYKNTSKTQSDLDLYQGMIRCGVCCTNIKDIALKKCMHLMCRACIDARMASRQKTCPLCGTIFSPNDIANIYL